MMHWFLILTFVTHLPPGNLVYCPGGCTESSTEQKRVEMPDELSCMVTKDALKGTPITAECLGEIRK
jgi:cobyrinic acid a,c-diamide synthase